VNRNTAIIFGANGQDGFYLSQLLLQNGIAVQGISRSGNWIKGSVADKKFVTELIAGARPEYIFHLAANSTTRYDAWEENHHTICDGTLYILDAVKQFSPSTKVFISGSGLQFANTGEPIHEQDPFDARDPYSVSRIHSVYAARYWRQLGLQTYVGYFFNHDSPLRSEKHMSQKIAAAAKRIAQGSTEKLMIGDLTTKKEWGFSNDIVKAIWLLVNQDQVTEAVIGTGKSYSIEEWLVACFGITGKNWQDYVVPLEGFTSEYKQLVSNPSTIMKLGWKQEVSFEGLANMMMQ
jgi:GDPmannose 4,6-dehydratase